MKLTKGLSSECSSSSIRLAEPNPLDINEALLTVEYIDFCVLLDWSNPRNSLSISTLTFFISAVTPDLMLMERVSKFCRSSRKARNPCSMMELTARFRSLKTIGGKMAPSVYIW